MKENINPYEMELLDLLNEVGGTVTVEYHTSKLTLTKEQLQILRDEGYETDVMTCVMMGLAASLKEEQKVIDYLREAQAAGASPSVSFEAAEGESLNITSPEENPMVDALVQAISSQNVN